MDNDINDVRFVDDEDGKRLDCDCERHTFFICEPHGNGYLYECQKSAKFTAMFCTGRTKRWIFNDVGVVIYA